LQLFKAELGLDMRMKNCLLALILVGFIFPSTVLFAQDCPKPSKKAQKLFDKAAKYKFRGQEGYQYLVDAVAEDPDFVEALSILAYLNTKRDDSQQRINLSKKYYQSSYAACPSYKNYDAAYWLGNHFYENREYEQAYDYLKVYTDNASAAQENELDRANELRKRIEKYRELFKNPVPFDPKLVSGVSSKDDEYLPMLSPDNQFLFYTRRTEVDSKSVYGKQSKELFIQSRKRYDGTYSGGIPLPEPFNQGAYQGGSTISVDNKLLFITIVDQVPTRDGVLYSNGDIYYAEFKGGKWSDLKSIGEHINGVYSWEGQPSISADNQTLYFASARGEDNYGGMDLYKVNRLESGKWGKPINLGPTVNTSGDEKSPFMHSDSYTLYFSSDGHPGVGGQDIFFSKIDQFGNFGTPINIGVPINTRLDEHGFMVSTDGRYGYFSSNLGKEGLDIYYFDLPEKAKPKEVVFVKGKVESKDPEAAKGMSIELKNMATNQVVEGVVDEATGEYVAVIAASEKQDVMMMAKKSGYAFTSQYINSNKDVVGKPRRAEVLEFNPIEIGETYKINNINFDTDSYALNQQVMNILNEFIEFLDENPKVKIAIHGHTDNVGDQASNLELSTNRAKAVMNYLILEGISSARLEFKGFGESKPIASNQTEEGRAKNRRTEFVILSK
jgi:outer membrane protein OmpA-like peptidoglycan-associated protein